MVGIRPFPHAPRAPPQAQMCIWASGANGHRSIRAYERIDIWLEGRMSTQARGVWARGCMRYEPIQNSGEFEHADPGRAAD